MSIERLKGMIGLSIKAGKSVSGAFAVQSAVKSRRAVLVLVDGSASQRTQRLYQDMCRAHSCAFRLLPAQGILPQLLNRDNAAVLVVQDRGFAQAILKILDTDKPTGVGEVE